MTETLILQATGVFFLLNALNHFFFGKKLESYALSRGHLSPGQSVKLSALLMLAGGLGLLVEPFQKVAGTGLGVFLIIAAFTVHKFWDDRSNAGILAESLRFMRNIALASAIFWMLFS
jgi:DoxX.